MNNHDQVIDKVKWNYTVIENEIIETDLLDIHEKMLYVTLKRFTPMVERPEHEQVFKA